MPRDADRRRLTRLASAIGVVIGVAGVVFVVRTLVSRSDEVADAWSALEAPRLVLAVVLGAAAMWWIGRLWSGLLGADQSRPPTRRTMAWYFTGQLGKYVPGGIWPIVGRSEMAVRGGAERGTAYAATTLSMATTYGAAALVGGIGSLVSWRYPLAGVAATAAVVCGVLSPSIPLVGSTAARLFSRLGTPPSTISLARLVAAHAPSWVLISLATQVTASAFGADIGFAHMLCASSLSWLVGFLVVGVPGGIGVREAVFAALVSPSVPTGVAVSVAVASRVVFIVVDVACAAIAGLIAGRSAVRRTGSAEA